MLELFFKPFTGLVVLTSRTMAIPTRIVDRMKLMAFLAFIETGTEETSAVSGDVQDGFFLFVGQSLGIVLKKRFSIEGKDLR